MEDTQIINWEVEEEEETERPSELLGCNLEPLGRLRIFSGVHGPEKDFPLYLGKNVVGRMPDCSVALPFPSISKQHAVIEIFAWDKAPILQDCGSLNGTQILRPPKVLSPGMRHRLRNQELILFGDLPCQYYRRDVSLPFVSRGPLTVEETPRVQGGTQTRGLLLAEDSEEEIDSVAERCLVKEPSATASTLATVVPESDEEASSPAQDGPGPPFAFNLDSDTDEENPPTAVREASSTTETEQPKAKEGKTEIQLVKDQRSVKKRDNDTEVEGGARIGVVPGGVNLERNQPAGEDSDTDVEDESTSTRRPAEMRLEMTQPCGFIDSDTDVEEEELPVIPAVVPMKKRQFFHGVGAESPGASSLAHGKENPTGSDTDMEEDEGPVTVPPERNQTSFVIDNNTNDEEEVSAALTLACLKESHTITWNQNPEVEEHKAQSMVPKKSQSSTRRDSDTDMEEEGKLKKRQIVPKGCTGKAHSEKSQSPSRDNDTEMEDDNSSPGVHLERSSASAAVAINTQVETKHVTWTHGTDVEAEGSPTAFPVVGHPEGSQPTPAENCEMDAEEGTSFALSVVAGVRKSRLPAEGDTSTECIAAVVGQERALEEGTPVAQVKQDLLPVSKKNLTDLVVDTSTSGAPTQPQREGTLTPTTRERELHVHGTKHSGENHDDSEDLDLQATQCFVERENWSLEAGQSTEEEPTQAFLFSQPQDPGPSHCSFQTPGALDESWEMLATQPFCPRESEASETQPIATYLVAHEPCASSPQGQHPENPVHTQSLEIQDTGHSNCQTPAKEASRGNQESPDACLPPSVPEASASLQSQKCPILQPFLPSPPSLEPPIPRTRRNRSRGAPEASLSSELEPHHPEPKVRPGRSSRMTSAPVSSLALEPHLATLKNQPMRSEPPAQVSRGKTRRYSLKTPEPVFPKDPQPQPSIPKDHPVTPKPTSWATRGRTQKASVKNPEPVFPSNPDLQPSTSIDQTVIPEPTSQATLGRTHRPVKTPKPVVPTTLEPQSSTPTGQPVPPEPTSRTTRGSTQRCSVKTPDPVVPTESKVQSSTSTDQPFTPEPTSRSTRGRTHRRSLKTPEPVVPTDPGLQPSTPTDQIVTLEPTSRPTRGRIHRRSVKTPEPVVPTDPGLQPSTPTDQIVTLEPTSRSTRARTHRRSVKTPEPVVATDPELHPSTSTDQPVTPEPTSLSTRGSTHRRSVKTPDPVVPTDSKVQSSTSTDRPLTPEPTSRATRGRVVPTDSKVQSSTSTDQPLTPEPTSRATRGRTHRPSVKTPEPVVPTNPERQPSTSKDQPLTPEPTSRATRGRTHRPSVKAPKTIVTTDPELQLSTSTNQLVTPEPTSQGRIHRPSVKTPEPGASTALELQSSFPKDQPITPESKSQSTWSRTLRSFVKGPELQRSIPTDQTITPEPTSQTTRGRTHKSVKIPKSGNPTTPEFQPSISKDQSSSPPTTQGRIQRSSVKTPHPIVPTPPALEPPAPTDQPISPKAVARTGQIRTLRSSTVSAMSIPTTPEFQPPVPTEQPAHPEPIPQANGSRRPKATRKHGSLTVSSVHELCPTPPEPSCQTSWDQRQGPVKTAESIKPASEPAFSQPPETSTQVPQVQKVEADNSGSTPEPHPRASQSCKRPLGAMDSPPLQKRLQRGEVPQKTVFKQEEDNAERPVKDEDVVNPGPVKRKRNQIEEPTGISSRLRRTKPNQESTTPKVLFTGVVDARGERAVLSLGGSLASSVTEASHLVTDRIRRTVKFLCALGRGIPILSLDWLHQSHKAGCFLPPDEYVVTDPEQEKNFGFSLREALHRAREQRLLEGYEIYVTPGVQPPPPQMGEIISCCGGTVLPSMPRSYKPQRIVITCSQDFPRCSIPCRVGLPVVSPEFLLTGVLKQEAKPEDFVLSTTETST